MTLHGGNPALLVAGAAALAACLREGAAPDLIELILTDNPIDGEGKAALVSCGAGARACWVVGFLRSLESGRTWWNWCGPTSALKCGRPPLTHCPLASLFHLLVFIYL